MVDDYTYLRLHQSFYADSGFWYRHVQMLGKGGNGVVFLTVATSGPNRGVPFAVKIFTKLAEPDRLQRFKGEIEFLKTCSHPSVMGVVDTGVFYERPFFVAEYLPETLREVIRSRRAAVVVKISYALQLLSALACLSQMAPPVIHRDVKPENVFVKGGSCLLGDFGLAKRVGTETDDDRGLLKESVGIGMPWYYRSPDQVAYLKGDAPLTTKSDVFQLGLVLAELFTGRNPHRRTGDPRAWKATDPVELEPLKPVPGSLGGPIGNVITDMLAFDPQERPDAIFLLALWEDIHRAAVERAHELEGRAIW